MSKTIDAQSARSIAAKAACGDNSVRNYYAGKPMRSCTEFRIRKAIIELGGEVPTPNRLLAVSSVPGSKA
jgi:hypothetical protein